ncbi:hypothetical protein ACIBG4_31840 [Nonomuraea sp. NPDC050383]|uniref:hypothetical protein n=1 Tax=Nonomuraea sp. NPDC050383 TaxID=3364362 RepID=UPI0037A33E6A
MRDEEGVEIAEPISTGIGQLETLAGDLDSNFQSDEATLRGLLASRVWGTGPAGTAFFQALQVFGGPERLLDDTKELVREIGKTPQKFRKAITHSLSTNEAVARQLAHTLLGRD